MALTDTLPAAPGLNIPDSKTVTATGLVESPGTPSSPNAWARFEFETGCGKEGSKVLVVEWDPTTNEDGSRASRQTLQDVDSWEVTWDGKVCRTKNEVKEREGETTHRALILIEDDAQVPPVVMIKQRSTGRTLVARPMPAIYTPALGMDIAKAAGRRGVLHTQW